MGDKNKIIYLMLGLGIGIIVTNVLHFAYPKLEYIELRDDEIIERATDLGMVKLKESIKLEKESANEKEEVGPEKGKDQGQEEIKKEKERLEEEIVVESGASLTAVATQLYGKDLIDNKEEFILFVRGKKLDRKIIIGGHRIQHNSSYDEIIKILTDRDYRE